MKNPRRTNGTRRNKLRARVLAAYTTCHICGQPVDKTLPAGNPYAAEVDELIPVSRGGNPYEFSNVALAHRICNELRGNHSSAWARAKLNQSAQNQSKNNNVKKYQNANQKPNKTSI